MKFSALSFTLAATLAGSLAWATAARAECMVDKDCTTGGTACGSSVCDWNQTPHACITPTGKKAEGWCNGADTDCKCVAQGANCKNAPNCSCTTPQQCGGGTSGGGSGSATSGSATSGSATSGSTASGNATSGSTHSGSATSGTTAGSGTASGGAPAGGGSSSSCSMGAAGSSSPWAAAAMALGACFAAARRRRRD